MRIARRIVGVALVAMLHGVSTSAAAQAAAPERVSLSPEQMETFLLEAKIVRSRPSGSGTTGTLRLTLSDGTVTHDASAQFIEVEQAIYRVQGYTEFNFRDCYCFNIAAYKLAVLLGIDNVPMSVERKVTGKPSAVTWWIDDVAMDEEGRRKKSATDPNPQRFEHYRYRQRVFDELIQNRDRNLGNTIYTKEWTTWMIDHTRAFRLNKDSWAAGGADPRRTNVVRQSEEADRDLTGGCRRQAASESRNRGRPDASRPHHQSVRCPHREGRRGRRLVHLSVGLRQRCRQRSQRLTPLFVDRGHRITADLERRRHARRIERSTEHAGVDGEHPVLEARRDR